MMDNKPMAITKVLTVNDIGSNNSHQAGMCIPKTGEVLHFFPDLGCQVKNPRTVMFFEDAYGEIWKLNFIYYNNKLFDEKGTRNEYRLTGMTAFFRENNLIPGDSITLIHGSDGTDYIKYKRQKQLETIQGDGIESSTRKKIVLGDNNWKVVDY